ncbi:MAG: hypothetical protein M3Z08_19035, partial [Chloroflexota bacterium]|nr:hypothetical protein [Chloroflexota bacterium]
MDAIYIFNRYSTICLSKRLHVLIPAYTCRTPHVDRLRVWPQPGKEPLVDVDRAILVAVHHQTTV